MFLVGVTIFATSLVFGISTNPKGVVGNVAVGLLLLGFFMFSVVAPIKLIIDKVRDRRRILLAPPQMSSRSPTVVSIRLKYFAMGLLFFFLFFPITDAIYSSFGTAPLRAFIAGLSIAVLLAVGISKGPSAGYSFGIASSISFSFVFLARLLFSPNEGSSSTTFLPLVLLFNPLILSIYGYLPARLFLARNSKRAFVGGFIGAVMADAVLTAIGSVTVAVMANYDLLGFLRFEMEGKVERWASGSVLGAISFAIVSRRLKAPTLPLPSEDIIGVIHSGRLTRGSLAGYVLVITHTRVIGAKKFKSTASRPFAAYLGRHSQPDPARRTKAYKLIGEIESNKDFEISKDQISAIEVKPASTWTRGHILFRTSSGDVEIKTQAKMDKEEMRTIMASLIEFAPDKLYEIDKGGVKRFFVEPRSEPQMRPAIEQQAKLCSNCGFQSVSDATFCTKCGTRLLPKAIPPKGPLMPPQPWQQPPVMPTAVPTPSTQWPGQFPQPPVIPQSELFQEYAEVHPIGEGGFARVYKAVKHTGETVALKIPITMDRHGGRAFLNEITVWRELNHPNIVRIYDFNIIPVPYLSMEYLEGGSLANWRRPLPFEEACSLMLRVAEGIAYAHSKGRSHRDLKPQNILMNRKGEPKITDWGLSRIASAVSSVSIRGYTPLYAAPEQIEPKLGKGDEKTDVYQFGVIFYELLTDQIPFRGESLAELYAKILNEIPAPVSELSPEAKPADGLIQACLQKAKDARPSIVEVKKNLASILEANYRQSLTLSKSRGNTKRALYYCSELAVLAARAGDAMQCAKYLADFQLYVGDDLKPECKRILEEVQSCVRFGLPITEGLLGRMDMLIHRARME